MLTLSEGPLGEANSARWLARRTVFCVCAFCRCPPCAEEEGDVEDREDEEPASPLKPGEVWLGRSLSHAALWSWSREILGDAFFVRMGKKGWVFSLEEKNRHVSSAVCVCVRALADASAF